MESPLAGETSLGNCRCTDGFSAAFRGGPVGTGRRDRWWTVGGIRCVKHGGVNEMFVYIGRGH